MRKEEFLEELEREVAQAKRQEASYGFWHVATIVVTVVLGAITTYLLATGYQESTIMAGAAAAITALGTFEKTFGFGEKKSLYRQVKTDFENLELDVKRLGTDAEVPQAFFDKFKDIRNQKIADT